MYFSELNTGKLRAIDKMYFKLMLQKIVTSELTTYGTLVEIQAMNNHLIHT